MNHSKSTRFSRRRAACNFGAGQLAVGVRRQPRIPGLPVSCCSRLNSRKAIQSGKAPILLSVAFPVLYRGKHIVHAINAGPTSKPEGIEALKNAVAKLPKDADLVIYCGCCPMVKCPNIRPAYRTLKELGFTHIRVLGLPTNLHTDWVSKDYPV